jgi:hypothetical protein
VRSERRARAVINKRGGLAFREQAHRIPQIIKEQISALAAAIGNAGRPSEWTASAKHLIIDSHVDGRGQADIGDFEAGWKAPSPGGSNGQVAP